MRVLITGHEGFLGSNITQNFLNKGHNVIGIDSKKTNIFRNYKNFSGHKINLLSIKKIFSLFEKLKKIDFIVHVAAKQPFKKDVQLDKYLKTNFYGTKNLIEASKEYGVKKIIFCSSFSVYGNGKSPIKENTLSEPRNTYGLSKYLAENLLKYYADKYGINVIVLRFDGIYGKNQNLPGFINMSFEQAIKNKQVILFNEGKLKRDNIYVNDAVKAVILATKKLINLNLKYLILGEMIPPAP